MNIETREIFDSTLYCVIATVTLGGAPQSIPVRFAYDDDCIYFRSSPDSSHSKNLSTNPQISVTIYDTTQSVKGAVYIHSSAEKVEGVDKERALAIFNDRFNNPPDQWGNTAYYRVPIGRINKSKTVEKMFYFQEYAG